MIHALDFIVNGCRGLIEIILQMSDLKKKLLCLEKIKIKNLGQNPHNMKHFLMKDFNYDCKKAMKLIDEAIVANIIKSVIFNGKVAFRIIRADSLCTRNAGR